MATYILRTYKVNRGCFSTINDLRKFVKSALELEIVTINDSSLQYIYEEEDDIIHLTFPPNTQEEFFMYFMSIKTLFIESKVQYIMVKTREEFPSFSPVNEEKITDWSKMITDLHAAGKIVVSETKSFCATDKRRFYFTEDSKDDEVDVDFLGTKMAYVENEKVINEWKKLCLSH